MSRSKKPVILLALAFGAVIALPLFIWLISKLAPDGPPNGGFAGSGPALAAVSSGPAADFDLDQLGAKARDLIDRDLAEALRRGEVSIDFIAGLKKEQSRAEADRSAGRIDRARERLESIVAAAEAQLGRLAAADQARALQAGTSSDLQRLAHLRPTYANTFEEAVLAYNQGSAALEQGDFVSSVEAFTLAGAILGDLEARGRQRINTLLETAQRALAAYELETARNAYAAVLEIERAQPAAAEGLEMVEALEGIAGEVKAVQEMEARGDLEAALSALESLAAANPGNPFIQQQMVALQKRIAARDFAEWVQASEAAEAAGDYALAISKLKAALERMPDAEQQARLERLEALYKAARVEQLLDAAFAALESGRYESARDLYKEALGLEPNLAEAVSGLEKASSLYLADIRYRQTLKGAERWIDEGRFPLAAKLFNEAMATRPPRLSPEREQQEAAIRERLEAQTAESPVRITSDRRTYVSVIGVRPPDQFRELDLSLFPDVYKLRGTRKGYRDVEVELRVDATKPNQTIHVACTERL